ncbi:type II toxin-antitoxin system HicA family toxin [bacterium]|nr:type II toxin-antitoxin system HicA family toxin [bacterium]
MSKLRKISGTKAIRTFEKLGFIQVRQRGSHVVMRKYRPGGDIGYVIPLHHELKIGT